jgi:phosphatidylglycerol:prolipoprotein diacylglycerol transferase
MTLYPLVFQLGPLTITGYGLMMMVAFLLAGWAMQQELHRRQMNEEYSADIVVAAVIGGIVGAKLWYVALTRDPGALFSRGGLVWYGGFLGGVAAVILNGWRRKVPLRLTMDIASPALALGYALGRVGCFLVQDDYGIPTTLPWGVKFPKGLPPTTAGNLQQMFGVKLPPGTQPWDVLAVHPTQLYEVAFMLTVFWIMWRMRAHRHALGFPFAVYLVFAGVERFLIEFLRAKDDRVLAGFTIAQATSVGLIIAGVLLAARFWKPDNFTIPADAGVFVQPPPTTAQKKAAG